jgi:hypothetical protein
MHFSLKRLCLFRELIVCELFSRHLQITPNLKPKVEVEMMFGDSNDGNDYDDHDLTTG